MRFNYLTLVVVFFFASVNPSASIADRFDPLFEEFDARPLRTDEKKFLQGALALQGYYKGLLDGAWGQGSQRALEQYSAENYNDIPFNIHMATLSGDFNESNRIEGWETYHFDNLGLSLILPIPNLSLIEGKEGFLTWVHRSSSLTVSSSRSELTDMVGVHNEIFNSSSLARAPYSVRNQNRWVTSIVHRNGDIVYLRSDLIGQFWSTILITAAERDRTQLNFISSSISVGRSGQFEFPRNGEIERFMKLALEWIESTESRSSQQSQIESETPVNTSVESYTGTGFYVDQNGSVLTNSHVIENCGSILVNEKPFKVSARSAEFDLALLTPLEPTNVFVIANFAARPARLNADVTVAGYPLHGLLGGFNVTRGSVTSLTGLRGDSLRMQISAPVQPGNSGGPVMDRSGDVIGVVVAKLDGIGVAEATGDIPQNINFAIRGEIAKLFLATNRIEYSISNLTERVEPTTIAENAAGFTVLIECN